jgi:hypothetical protein
MKNRARVFIIFVFITILSCEKTELSDFHNSYLQEFLNSKEFCKNESLFTSYGSIERKGTQIECMQDGKNMVQYLMIPIIKHDKTNAYIQAIKLREANLPNDEIWAMNLIDVTNFNNQTLTGTVSMLDVNLDGFKHSEIKVINNIISKWECFDLPLKLEIKYNINSKGYIKDFFKCYRRTREELLKNDVMYFVCSIASTECAIGITASCIYWLDGNYY